MHRCWSVTLALIAVVAILVICVVPAQAAGGVLLVRHLKGQSMDAGKAVLLTDLVIEDLRSTGQFSKIYSMSDLEAMLTQVGEQQKVDVNCDSTKCMLEYGNALGAERVLSGNVGKLGTLAIITLTLFDTKAGSTEASRTWKCDCSEEVLAERIAGYAREIFGLETPAQREARLATERRAREDAERRDREARAVADARVRAEQEAATRTAAERAAAERRAQEGLNPSPTTGGNTGVGAGLIPAHAGTGVGNGGTPVNSDSTWTEPMTGMVFLRISGEEFEMGSNEGDSDETPVRRIRVSDFLMAKSEVTQAQWRSVMGSNPSKFQGCDDCPVEQVSWTDVQEFVRKASAQTGLSLRLPTEAEWEYAAGGGAAHQKWAGTNHENELGDYAWYTANSGSKTHPVCQKRPNLFGLCDMSGNVWEWVADWKGDYSSGYATDPTGPSSGAIRVDRGGSWGFVPGFARVANRGWDEPGYRGSSLGFRLVAPPGQR